MTKSRPAPTVGERMALQPIVVRADASLSEAARLLDSHHISGLPVVDPSGALVGVVSQTDLARARATEYLWANWPGLAVRHLMTTPAVTVHSSMPLAQAAKKMERHHIHRLVVVADDDETLPIGILSMTDLIHAIAEETAVAEAPAGVSGGTAAEAPAGIPAEAQADTPVETTAGAGATDA